MQKKETMDLIEFTKKFPDEESCKTHFKALRDAQAKKCPHCQGTAFYWKNDKEMYECKECHYRMSLKKGTVMEHGLTQVELSEKSGVGLRFVRELEQGKQTLRLDKVNQVLNLFGTKVGVVPMDKTTDQ